MKLNINDEIRVIAPSISMVILSEDTINIANEKLLEIGLKVSFGKNVMKSDDYYNSSSIDNRVSDLHDAFKDKKIKGILTAIGGYNCNQILNKINYKLIKDNPKIICGYSDITAILLAIYAKTGIVTYYGPHYSTFGMKMGNEYTIDYFNKIMFNNKKVTIKSSKDYSDDLWFIDQEKRKIIKNIGMKAINLGKEKGLIIGGNLCTLNLLQGTEYMPIINENIILFLEDDGSTKENFFVEFDRNLISFMQTQIFKHVKGIVIGRCQQGSNMNCNKWKKLLDKEELKLIPIVIDADFGHTTPMFTFPIGGHCSLKCTKDKIELIIEKN